MRIKTTHLLGLAIVISILQMSLLGFLEIASVKPDLMFLLVVMSSLYLPLRQGIYTNWCIGALTDIASNASFGSFAFLFMFIGLLISLLKEIFFREDLILRLGVTFLSVFICHLLYGIGLSVSLWSTGISLGFFFILIKAFFIAFYTVALALLVFLVLDRVGVVIKVRRLRKEMEG